MSTTTCTCGTPTTTHDVACPEAERQAKADALLLARQFVNLTQNARTNYLSTAALELREMLDAKLREAGL